MINNFVYRLWWSYFKRFVPFVYFLGYLAQAGGRLQSSSYQVICHFPSTRGGWVTSHILLELSKLTVTSLRVTRGTNIPPLIAVLGRKWQFDVILTNEGVSKWGDLMQTWQHQWLPPMPQCSSSSGVGSECLSTWVTGFSHSGVIMSSQAFLEETSTPISNTQKNK